MNHYPTSIRTITFRDMRRRIITTKAEIMQTEDFTSIIEIAPFTRCGIGTKWVAKNENVIRIEK